MHDEEVPACIALNKDAQDYKQTRQLFDYNFARLAYYKAPGWITFLDCIPISGTQKIHKHALVENNQDPRLYTAAFDLRKLKKRL